MQPTRKPHIYKRNQLWHLRAGAWHFVSVSRKWLWDDYLYSTQWKSRYAR